MLPAFRARDACLLGLLLLLGGSLRLHTWYETVAIGDEHTYATYLRWVLRHGVGAYPELLEQYREQQDKAKVGILPPTRFTFIAASAATVWVFRVSPVDGLRAVAKTASILMLLLVWASAWLLRGPPVAHGTLALLAVSPLQVQAATYGFIDIVFACAVAVALLGVALWVAGGVRAAAGVLALALPLMVLTKESAAFLLPALALAFYLGRGNHGAAEWRVLCLGAVGGAVLTALAVGIFFGGLGEFYGAVVAHGSRVSSSGYSVAYQSGPWFRYAADYLLMTPVVFLGFVACAGRTWREGAAPGRAVLALLAVSLLPMALLPAGLNLRFALPWDPLVRFSCVLGMWLACAGQTSPSPARRFAWIIGLMAAADLAHFLCFFSDGQTHDPTTLNLLRALGIFRGE